jgi:hypothetical protein
MAIERANIDYNNATTESFATKLYSDEFNALQLEKSVDGLYEKYSKFFSTGLIDSIKKA